VPVSFIPARLSKVLSCFPYSVVGLSSSDFAFLAGWSESGREVSELGVGSGAGRLPLFLKRLSKFIFFSEASCSFRFSSSSFFVLWIRSRNEPSLVNTFVGFGVLREEPGFEVVGGVGTGEG